MSNRWPTPFSSGEEPCQILGAGRCPMPDTHRFEAARRHPFALDLEIQGPASLRGTHLHLACEDEHRSFCVGFRTVPGDDTGLPHILEHLSLCGSERYPVRDPFFMMLRRSLQTFMNAFTYPDMTCYPFATQVAKDFDNLLAIYLDAVFAPRLDPLDFAQEGWRLEPQDGADGGEDPTGWALKGVVYNEMKGAMGESDSLIFDALGRQLLPGTCAHNSGGDPRAIAHLVHEDLVAFHRSRYNGANACFTTYGKLDVDELQARFECYLEAHPGEALPAESCQSAPLGKREEAVQVPLAEGQDPWMSAAPSWPGAGPTAAIWRRACAPNCSTAYSPATPPPPCVWPSTARAWAAARAAPATWATCATASTAPSWPASIRPAMPSSAPWSRLPKQVAEQGFDAEEPKRPCTSSSSPVAAWAATACPSA